MKEYATEQRRVLLTFLRNHYDQPFSIEELASQLCTDSAISVSAIYRNIGKLVSEGHVQRFTKDNCRKFYYQFIGNPQCSEHLHLMCNRCGQIFHMDHASMGTVLQSVRQNNDFSIDIKKTILYGCCKACM